MSSGSVLGRPQDLAWGHPQCRGRQYLAPEEVAEVSEMEQKKHWAQDPAHGKWGVTSDLTLTEMVWVGWSPRWGAERDKQGGIHQTTLSLST